MFFVSDIKDNKIGITDSDDMVEEFFFESDVVRFVEKDKLNIYGLTVYNHKTECRPMHIGVRPRKDILVGLLDKWKGVHNKWTGQIVEDYLSSLKVGTVITVDYSDKDTSGRVFRGRTEITKTNQDEWLFSDDLNTFSGKKDDSRFGAWCLEVAYIFSSQVKALSVK